MSVSHVIVAVLLAVCTTAIHAQWYGYPPPGFYPGPPNYNDYPSRRDYPSRPDYSDYPSRPDYSDYPSRPDYPDYPSRPDSFNRYDRDRPEPSYYGGSPFGNYY